MAIVNVLHTIEKLQKYMLHKINFEYIYLNNWTQPEKMCFDLFLQLPLD